LPQLALGLAVLILSLKIFAYLLTGSIALLSDALESIVNVVAALIAIIAINLAARPADASHPYGHSKFEYLSAVFEGILIIFAAFIIAQQAYSKFMQHSPLADLGLAAVFSIIATLLNAGLATALYRYGKRERSPAILADSKHLWADVITTLVILSGLFLAKLSGWWWLDPVFALLVAINILFMGWLVVRESLGGLLDEGLEAADLEILESCIKENMSGALEVHDLRTRRAARRTFVSFHLVVPGDISVNQAHEICDRLEAEIAKKLPGVFTTIHVEPDNKAHHEGFRISFGENSQEPQKQT